jgi:hypothetical protein
MIRSALCFTGHRTGDPGSAQQWNNTKLTSTPVLIGTLICVRDGSEKPTAKGCMCAGRGLVTYSLPSAGRPDLSSVGKCAGAKGTPKNKFINSYIFIFSSFNSALVCRAQNFYLVNHRHWFTMKSCALILLLACSIGYS